MEHAGLIELDGSRHVTRLELETVAGMLSLHPADDGVTAHGNVVRTDQVDPITVPWAADSGIRVVRDPFASALLHANGQQLTIESDLTVSIGEALEEGVAHDLDDRGLPRLIDHQEWPLEV